MTWVLDLDGVVWHGSHAIEGSVDAIAKLRQSGIGVAFVTNNSTMGAQALVHKFAGFGIEVEPEDIVSAHDLLVAKVGTGKRILAAAAPGLVQILRDGGNTVFDAHQFIEPGAPSAQITDPPPVDLVVGGQNFHLDYLQLSVAMRAILQCKTLYSANRDPLYPSSSGMMLGTGSIIAALETASGVSATIFGKPSRIMVDALLERFPDTQLIVGDQLSMDGVFAAGANIAFGHVLSGVDAQRASASTDVPVAHQAKDLASLVEALS